MTPSLSLRLANDMDREAIWRILEPTIRAGETWALPRDWTRDDALTYWFAAGHEVWLCERGGIDGNGRIEGDARDVVGTYFLRTAQLGPGAHVANAGYMVDPSAWGIGVASNMCDHSLDRARALGFTAMQFNFVVSTNARAIALWERKGFRIIGRSPLAYQHATLGAVDAVMMHRAL